MNPGVMAVFFRALTLQTVTFSASTTWVAPNVNLLSTVSGHGATGAIGAAYSYTYHRVAMTVWDDGRTLRSVSGFVTGPEVPLDYCDDHISDSPNSRQTCYTFPVDAVNENPPTTGASAIGFGVTFPGSIGDATPSPFSISNIAITPGGSYSVIVPAGATLSITFYQ